MEKPLEAKTIEYRGLVGRVLRNEREMELRRFKQRMALHYGMPKEESVRVVQLLKREKFLEIGRQGKRWVVKLA